MVVRWVRGLAPYQTLSARDQVGSDGKRSQNPLGKNTSKMSRLVMAFREN